MKFRNVQRVLHYHVPNKHRFTEKYAHQLLFLFYLFHLQSELLGVNKTYQKQLRDEHILSVINTNNISSEHYADLVDEAYTNWNAELAPNQNTYGKIENLETKSCFI